MVFPRDNLYPDERYQVARRLDTNETLDTARNTRGIQARNNVGIVERVREDSVDIIVLNDDGSYFEYTYCRISGPPYPLKPQDTVHYQLTSTGAVFVQGLQEDTIRSDTFLAHVLTTPTSTSPYCQVVPTSNPRLTLTCSVPSNIELSDVQEGLTVGVSRDTGLLTSASTDLVTSYQPRYWITSVFRELVAYSGNPNTPYVGVRADDTITIPSMVAFHIDGGSRELDLTPSFSATTKYYRLGVDATRLEIGFPIPIGFTAVAYDVGARLNLPRLLERDSDDPMGTTIPRLRRLFNLENISRPTTIVLMVQRFRNATFTTYTMEARV